MVLWEMVVLDVPELRVSVLEVLVKEEDVLDVTLVDVAETEVVTEMVLDVTLALVDD